MKKLNLSLVQMRCEKGTVAENLGKMEEHAAQSAQKGADVICFPEMNITGYIEPSRYPEAVLKREDPAIKQVAAMSRKLGTCIIAGFVEDNPRGKPFITQFVAEEGRVKGFYRKKTIKGDEACWFSPGDSLLAFEYLGVKMGIAVCADIDDQEIFKGYAQKGVSLVFECAAPGLYGEQKNRNWESGFNWWKGNCREKLGKYAASNGIYIAVATQAGRTVDEDFPGGGYLFDSDGRCRKETPDWREGILLAEVSLRT